MLKTMKFSDQEILIMLKMLPESKRIEVLDFLDFLTQKTRKEERKNFKMAVYAVEDTWKSIKLDKATLKYIAEDKELEYEI